MNRRISKRIGALMLAVFMCFSMLPTAVFAVDDVAPAEEPAAVEQQAVEPVQEPSSNPEPASADNSQPEAGAQEGATDTQDPPASDGQEDAADDAAPGETQEDDAEDNDVAEEDEGEQEEEDSSEAQDEENEEAEEAEDEAESGEDDGEDDGEEEDNPACSFSADAAGMTVSVKAGEGVLPEGTEISVVNAGVSLDAVIAAFPDAVNAAAVRISFTKDGEEVYPAGKVTVTLKDKTPNAEADYAAFSVSGGAVTAVKAAVSGASATFKTGTMKVFGLVESVKKAEDPGEPGAEEPGADDPIVEEPGADDPIADDPVAEEPAVVFTVSFMVDGKAFVTTAVAEGALLSMIPEAPVFRGYDFVGWFSDGVEVTAETAVAADMDVQAVYERNEEPLEFTVSFVADGELVEERVVLENAEIGELPDAPEKSNYDFTAWKAGDENITAETVVTEDMTIAAAYTLQMPAQSFDGIAGNVTVEVQAPEGAFPYGTVMNVTPVYDKAMLNSIAESVEGRIDGYVDKVVAVDITFLLDGDEIEPLVPIKVVMRAPEVVGDAQVVHVDEGVSKVADATNGVAEFHSDSFSVYALITTTDKPRLTLNFYNGSTLIETMYVKGGVETEHYKPDTAAEIQQIVYDLSGQIQLGSNEVFYGWTTTSSYSVAAADSALSLDQVRANALSTAGALTADETVNYYAVILKSYYVDYIGDFDVVVGSSEIRFLPSDSPNQSYEVNMAYTPIDNTHNFEGWLVHTGGSNIAGHTEGKLYKNETTITISGDVTFSVDAPEGQWLVFNENGKGATYYSPQFVRSGAVTQNPVTEERPMERLGYSFAGWYTGAPAVEYGEPTGQLFSFGNPLPDALTLYAKWTKQPSANYTVLLWQQNIACNGYDFAQAVSLSGAAEGTVDTVSQQGSGDDAYVRINSVNYSYTGFHLKTFDQNVTINPDGSSVVNVYFDRNEYTLQFQTARTEDGCGGPSTTWTTVYTITAKYQQPIGSHFPISGEGITAECRWEPQNSTTFQQVLVYIDIMPAENVIFHEDEATADTRYMEYYVEALPGQTAARTFGGKSFVKLGNTIPARYNFFTEAEDFINLTGYQKFGSDPAFSEGRAEVDAGGTIYFYYTRSTYSINYMDGVYIDGNGIAADENNRGQLREVENIAYGADLSAYNAGGASAFTPTYSGYIFDKWYVDESCTQAYTFTTMPENGITLYARWIMKQYRVFIHPNAGTDPSLVWGEGVKLDFRVNQGGTVSLPTGLRTGFEFVGWFSDEDCSIPFNSGTPLNETTTSYYPKTEKTEYNMWGVGTQDNQDVDRPQVVGKLDIYGLWRSTLDGAEGMGVLYNPVGLSDVDGTTPVGTGSTTSDGKLYKDMASATAITGASAPNGYRFEYWVLQEWNGTDFADTTTHVYAGGTFTVLKASARVEDLPPEQQTEAITKSYTVQLRAQYVKIQNETPTHINWYPNGGSPNTPVEIENLSINEPVEIQAATTFSRTGYSFVGWAKSSGATVPWLAWNSSTGTFSENGVTVTHVAADERTPYDDIYALWEENEVTISYAVASDSTGLGTVSVTSETVKVITGEANGSTAAGVSDAYVIDYWTCGDSTEHIGTDAEFKPSKNGDGLYEAQTYYAHFKQATAGYTIHHYLVDTTTKVADDQTGSANVGSSLTPTPYSLNAEQLYADYKMALYVSSDPASVEISATETNNVISVYYKLAVAALTVTKTADKATGVYTGDSVTYTVKVTNSGDVAVTGIELTDALMAAADVPAAFDLEPGANKEVSYVYTVTQEDVVEGKIDNTATAAGKDPLNADVSGSASLTVETVAAEAALTVTKTADKATGVYTGDTVTYTVKVTNSGNVTVSSIKLTDALMAAADVPAAFDLEPGANKEVSYVYTVTQEDVVEGKIDNTATAAGKDPLNADVSGSASLTVETVAAEAALTVTKTADKATGVYTGDTVTYTVKVTNSGNVTVSSIKLTDALMAAADVPAAFDLDPGANKEVSYVYTVTQEDVVEGKIDNTATAAGKDPLNADVSESASLTVETVAAEAALTVTKTADKATGVFIGDTVTYTVKVTNSGNVTVSSIELTDALMAAADVPAAFDLDPGANKEVSYVYTVTQDDVAAGKIDNTATAAGKDPLNADVSESATLTVETVAPEAKLTVTKTADKATGVFSGDTVTYTVKVTNSGTLPIKDISIQDALMSGSDVPAAFDLDPGASSDDITYVYTVTQEDVAAGKIDNTATAVGLNPASEEVKASATLTIETAVIASLTVTKTADKATGVYAGDVVTFTINVTNSGNVKLTDLTLEDDHGTPSGYVTELEAGASTGDITYTYTVSQDDMNAGSFTNTVKANAKASGGSDPEEATASVTIETAAAEAALTVTKTADKTSGVYVGDVITYTINVTNSGNVKVTGLTLEDDHGTPSGFETDLEAGASTGDITYTYTVTQDDVNAGLITNTVKANAVAVRGDDPAEAQAQLNVPTVVLLDTGAVDVARKLAINGTGESDSSCDSDCDGETEITVSKTFYFEMTPVNSSGSAIGQAKESSLTFNKTSSRDGERIDFGTLSFAAPGVYNFQVKELTTGQSEGDGWEYDNAVHDVTVTVTADPETGKLSASVTQSAEVRNTFVSKDLNSDTIALGFAGKTVVGTGFAPQTFSFKLTPAEGAPVPSLLEPTLTISAEGSQPISFGSVDFSVSGTYTYTVEETGTAPKGWTFDTGQKTVTVKVERDCDGDLTVSCTGVVFTNTYKAESVTVDTSAAATAFATKTVSGTGFAETSFAFSITPGTGAPAPTSSTGSVTMNAAGSQIVDFGTITFDEPGDYSYTVKETSTATKGWTFDNTEKTVEVSVTDDGYGQLVAAVTGVTIENSYKAESVTVDTSAADTAFATKTVTGTGFAETSFDFAITPGTGAPAAGSSTASVTMSAAGSQIADFGQITFDEAGDFSYTVQETGTATKGWTFDNAEKTVAVSITDDGYGQLVAAVTGVTIENSYKAESVTVDTAAAATAFATKTVAGSGFAETTFKFTITAGAGAPAPGSTTGSVKMNAAGSKVVDFGKITFDEAGTYTYTVKETNTAAAHWTFDTAQKTVTVTVTDDGYGQLVAAVKGVTIKNSFALPHVTVTISALKDTVKYDGKEHKLTGFSAVPSNAAYSVSAIVSGATEVVGTDAGSYTLDLSGVTFTNTDPNFTVTFEIDTANHVNTLTITPRTVVMTSGSDEKDYDGEALTNDTVTVTGDGFAAGQGATYSFTGTQTDGGSSENSFTYTLTGGAKAENYSITTEFGTLTVNPPVVRQEIVEETLEEEETPLAAPAEGWALLNLIASILTVCTGAGMVFSYFKKKNDKSGAAPSKSKFAGLIPSVGSVVTFLLTENLGTQMILTDKWTAAMIAILAAGGALAFFTRTRLPKKDKP